MNIRNTEHPEVRRFHSDELHVLQSCTAIWFGIIETFNRSKAVLPIWRNGIAILDKLYCAETGFLFIL